MRWAQREPGWIWRVFAGFGVFIYRRMRGVGGAGGVYGVASSALVSACHIKTVPLGGRWNPLLCCKRTVRPSLWHLSGLVPESCVHAVILTSHLALSKPLPPVAALGFLNGNDCETTTHTHTHTHTRHRMNTPHKSASRQITPVTLHVPLPTVHMYASDAKFNFITFS